MISRNPRVNYPPTLRSQDEVVTRALGPLKEFLRLNDLAGYYAGFSKAGNTNRAYRFGWEAFAKWCDERGAVPLPVHPLVMAHYLADQASKGLRLPTLSQRLAAIKYVHQEARQPFPKHDPDYLAVWEGLKRALSRTKKQARPITIPMVQHICRTLPKDEVRAARDRALLLVGFVGGFRRAELVGLDFEDLDIRQEGIIIQLERSKTDQYGKGQYKAIEPGANEATCPVRALKQWLAMASIEEGPIFRRWAYLHKP